MNNSPMSVAMISTFPPTECGLATYARNLRQAIIDRSNGWAVGVVRVIDHWEPQLDMRVATQWLTNDKASLQQTRARLNTFDAVVLQHEFGIFGGQDGQDVLDLVEGIEPPVITVLHTVLPKPDEQKLQIVNRLLAASTTVVVHSHAARAWLLESYAAREHGIQVIPHGVRANFWGTRLPDIPHPSVMTWGLLSPGKGIESGIRALGLLHEAGIDATYIVAGRTHPNVQAREGERYRRSLRELAVANHLEGRVLFDDEFRSEGTLRALVRSADVVLLPYLTAEQISSGVLVESLAAGRPVVATAFPHAQEMLASGAGIVVQHDDVPGMADALAIVLRDADRAALMRTAAQRKALDCVWPVVGAQFRALLSAAVSDRRAA